jgi:septal ring factor EnvC (AmiA/AmiB activator)
MNIEKVKEIKKVLEQNTKTCLLYDFEKNIDCKVFQCKYILDYINEVESENERLVEERDLYKKQFNELEPRFFDLRYDNQKLKDRIAKLENEKAKWQRKAKAKEVKQ